jgi:hypothetical protein
MMLESIDALRRRKSNSDLPPVRGNPPKPKKYATLALKTLLHRLA